MWMTASRPGLRTLLVVVALLALTACGSGLRAGTAVESGQAAGSATGSAAGSAPANIGGWPVPPGCPGLPEPRRLTRSELPTAALQCVGSTQVVPGDGEYAVAVTQRATQGLHDLVSALLLPDSPPPGGGVACTLYASQNWVVLELGQNAVAVATPVDGCGHRLPQVDRALAGLRWAEVSRTRGARLRDIAAVTAKCQAFKDLLTYFPATEFKPATAQPSIGTGGDLKVCLYSVSYPDGWTADGRQGLDGVPIGGGTLTGDRADLVRAALGKVTPAGTCTRRHTRFAVISPLSPAGAGAGWLSIELDGCRRILTDDNHVSQAMDALINALTLPGTKS
jgi:hypothetical protein